MKNDLQPYLQPTAIIDSTHPAVRSFTLETVGNSRDPLEQAQRLYLAVRDGIRYDPYAPFHLPAHYRASYVLQRRRSFCIPKAALLCAAARASGIPARLGFANVKNHLATRQLIDFLGCNLFVFHGYTDLFLDGKWVKATPAFNRELCERHRVPPLEFTGHEDSLFQPYNSQAQKYMEYVDYLGTYPDVPVEEILEAWSGAYGRDRVRSWIALHKERNEESLSNFEQEEVYCEG